ncbi:cytochrome P450 140 Cyp140 [Mycobacterium tuberculosis XTB13-089]|uniref:cytochrome P450 n=1 Tax=Mycobacterium tuberculosis TaxID=1773 RepID=UPI000459720E|nr:cytochrome P450 [Mycobacterium tuberculosis]KCS27045.1 cytochrome P450 140 Cyp140 [Mycobacterium tuberculosis XTB13-089]KCT68252.1 cytochrome P450 140 Cyp140 [Mycobacterium tuberculosis XTB13-135]CFJ19621.1 cytochrome p450 140 CYP140 [Mycobacterium tuberculosis]CMF83516.1 cytochrome p450 140 CYP140 [Mycobacterium tuberculosis]CMG34752.1 cytochrome p450 140 CYP140 [Mycobacterium tuberculosis]
MKDKLHWLAMHGVIRGIAAIGIRRGDLQARLIADPAVATDPVPFYDEVRSHGALVRNRANYLTVDHRLAHDLLRSDDFRVVSFGENLPPPLRWLERRTRGDQLHPLREPSLLAVEPPDHTRYRKTVSAVFTSRTVSALRDLVEQTAINLLDRFAEQPGIVDVVGRYCSQLPIVVISEILGVPEHDRPRVLEFGELAAPSLDIGIPWRQYLRVQQGIRGFDCWLEGHLQQLRHAPGDDLMSQLIQIAESGDNETQLDETELRAIAGLVLVAGFETTVNLLGNGIRMLLDTPEHLATLRQHPELWPNTVEEILRLDSPVQLTARVACRDVEVAGVRIKRGEVVVIYLAAANRDPAVFPDPHRFDIERPNAGRHLAFSTGRHFCLGAALARAEGEVGLRTFFDRFPDVRAAGAGSRRDTRVLRGWSTLPVTLGPARSMVSP